METLKIIFYAILTCLGVFATFIFISFLPVIILFGSLELEYVFSLHDEDIAKYYPLVEAKAKEAQQQEDSAPCLELPYELKYLRAPQHLGR